MPVFYYMCLSNTLFSVSYPVYQELLINWLCTGEGDSVLLAKISGTDDALGK